MGKVRWISVEEKLPNDCQGREAAVWATYEVGDSQKRTIASYNSYLGGWSDLLDYNTAGEAVELFDVKYWAAIDWPEPPQGG